MHRNILSLLLIAVFMAGCTHAKPFYYQAEGQAQPQPRAQYCPVAAFEGNKQLDSPGCASISGVQTPEAYDSDYALNSFMSISYHRDALTACYAALPENQQKNGMFFADIVINGFGKAVKITWINASVNPDIPALDAPPEMLSCFNGVLSDIAYPKQGDQQRVIRGYFLAYRGIISTKDAEQSVQSVIKCKWDKIALQNSNPYEKAQKYFRKGISKGLLTPSLAGHVIAKNMRKINACYQNELSKNPNLKGKVTIKVTIALTGQVTGSEVIKTTMQNVAAEDCIAREIKHIIFPKMKAGGAIANTTMKPGGSMTFIFPIKFYSVAAQ